MTTPSLAAPGGATPARSLILAGGGMRVAYQAGVLRALEDAGLRFSHADGTSGGTLNLAMLLSGQSPGEMCERWLGLHVRDFVSLLPWRDYFRPLRLPAMGSASGLREHVFPELGIDLARICASEGLPGTFNVCNFTWKTSEVVEHQRMELPLLVAGLSLPIFMPPVEWNGRLYCDAVWIRDANLMEAVRRGAEEVWVVWAIGNSPRYRPGMFNEYVHMIELSANGKLFDELAQIADINARIARGDVVGGRTRPVRVHIIRPERPLPLDPDFYLGRIDAATLVAMGYRDATRYLSGMRPAGTRLGPEVTRMTDIPPAVAFRKRLTGRLRWGAVVEPAELLVAVEAETQGGSKGGGSASVPAAGMLHLPGRSLRTFATAASWHPADQSCDMAFRLDDQQVSFVVRPARAPKFWPWRALTRFEVDFNSAASAVSAALQLRPAALVAHVLGVHAVSEESTARRALLVARHWALVMHAAVRRRREDQPGIVSARIERRSPPGAALPLAEEEHD